MGLRPHSYSIEKQSFFDVTVFCPHVVGAQGFCSQLPCVDFGQPFVHPLARGLRGFQIFLQGASNACHLLLELFRIDGLGRSERFHLGVIFAEAGIEEEGVLSDGLLIIWQNFLDRRVLNIERSQHPHEFFALELPDLFQPAAECLDGHFGLIDSFFLL